MLESCKSIEQYHSQDFDIDSEVTELFYQHKDPLCCPFIVTNTFLPLPSPPCHWQLKFVLHFYNFVISSF